MVLKKANLEAAARMALFQEFDLAAFDNLTQALKLHADSHRDAAAETDRPLRVLPYDRLCDWMLVLSHKCLAPTSSAAGSGRHGPILPKQLRRLLHTAGAARGAPPAASAPGSPSTRPRAASTESGRPRDGPVISESLPPRAASTEARRPPDGTPFSSRPRSASTDAPPSSRPRSPSTAAPPAPATPHSALRFLPTSTEIDTALPHRRVLEGASTPAPPCAARAARPHDQVPAVGPDLHRYFLHKVSLSFSTPVAV